MPDGIAAYLDKQYLAEINGERWSVFTNGYGATVRKSLPDDAPTEPENVPLFGFVRTLLSTPCSVVIPAPALLAFVGQPCERCADSHRQTCSSCDGTLLVDRECTYCDDSHRCHCRNCDGDGWVACPSCRGPSGVQPARVLPKGGFYDCRLLGPLLRAMPKVETYYASEIDQKSKDNPGNVLILKIGDQFAAVMSMAVHRDRIREYPSLAIPTEATANA